MKYYSLGNPNIHVSAKEALLQGLAPDGSLYMPERIPRLDEQFLHSLEKYGIAEIGKKVLSLYLGDEVPGEQLADICEDAFSFSLPLVEVTPNTYSLELYHGPTYAFKDFAARFMARLMSGLIGNTERELVILVATSGDTGSAVAHGFYRVPGIRVVILYPSGKVSELQEKQLTSLGENIAAFEVEGTFDDCQSFVKRAFVDEAMQNKFWFSSANSINAFRLIPQMTYYFAALSKLRQELSEKQAPVFSVPSGNFGNLTAGLMAKRMGLEVKQFIAATNVNDVVPKYLETAEFRPRASVSTLSNAMDVGNPSNFPRMLALYEENNEALRRDLWGCSFDDELTLSTISKVYREAQYVLDPHGAVSWLALERYREKFDYRGPGIVLETAHPAKFGATVERAIGNAPKLPEGLLALRGATKSASLISNSYDEFRKSLSSLLS